MESKLKACVIDIDGTLYQGNRAIPGAAAAVAELRASGIGLCFATNTSRLPRSGLVKRLAAMGITIAAEELHTAPLAAARWLAEQGARKVSLLLPLAAHEEFTAFEPDDESPDFVVVGDLAREWTFTRMNTAFRALLGGAGLVAIHRNRYWDDGSGLQLDAGPFVAALEYASGREAVLVGKPSPPFYTTVAASLGLPRSRIAVVGDSIVNDAGAAQAVGCVGVAVRTGIFREEHLANLKHPPDQVLDSIADLPRWLVVRRREFCRRFRQSDP